MAATSNRALIDEISDQFLVCQICSESFKRPKTLKCLHTFCEECLEIRYAIEEQERPYRFLLSRSLSCPTCLAKTELPPGGVRRLPSNAVLTQLDDVIRRRKLSAGAQSCDICSAVTSSSCRAKASSRATAKCLECSKMMCDKCAEIHRRTKVTKDHCLFDIQVEKDVECKVHREEAIRFYCEQCQSCICVLCTFQDHASHAILSFSEGINRYSDNVRSLLAQARSRSQRLGAQLTALSRCETSLKSAEEAIRNTAVEQISGVRRRERELMAQLRCIYDEETDGLTSQRELVTEMLRNINATCDLADVLLQEKSVEFLLVHREIADKLSSVLQSPVRELPEELLTRSIRFRASKNAIEPVGYLHVSDSPRDESKDNSVSHERANHSDTDGSVEDKRNVRRASELKLESFRDRKPECQESDPKTSSADAFTSFDACCCCCLDRTDMLLRGRPNYAATLRPPSPRGPDLWPPPVKLRRRTETDHVQLWDSETETVALVTDTKGTSTVSISRVDRSTLTTIHTTCDRMTSTDWLVMSRDQETSTTPPVVFSGSVQTDSPRLSSKCIQFHPETLNKLTMTRKPIQLERETNTPIVARFDCDVTARIIGDDKSTSTRKILTVDAAVGCDLDFELEEEFDRSFALRRGNRRRSQRPFKPDSSSSLFVQNVPPIANNCEVGLSRNTGPLRYVNVSSDDDDGYCSRLKLIPSEENLCSRPGHSPLEAPDRELAELENYRHYESCSASLTGIHWRDSSFSSSVPSLSSSSLLLSSSSSRRVSPSSTSIVDDLSCSTESFQRCIQTNEQTTEPTALSRQIHAELLPSGFADELSTLEENDEELDSLTELILVENIPEQQQLKNLRQDEKLGRASEHSPIVSNDRLSSGGESTNPPDPPDPVESEEGITETRRKTQGNTEENNSGLTTAPGCVLVSAEISKDEVTTRSEERTANEGLQILRHNETTTREVVDICRVTDNNTSKKLERINDSNCSEIPLPLQGSSPTNSDLTAGLCKSRLEEEFTESEKDSGMAIVEQVKAADTDIFKTTKSTISATVPSEVGSFRNPPYIATGASLVAGDNSIVDPPPDITTDILSKKQIPEFPEMPIDSPAKDETSDTAIRALDAVATKKLQEVESYPKAFSDKFVASMGQVLSPKTSRSLSKRMEQVDFISETSISANRSKTAAASTLPEISMKNASKQLERLLPEIRAIATSLDCSSSSSSLSPLVHLLINICSVIAKGDKLNFPLDTAVPLDFSEILEATNGPTHKNHCSTGRPVFMDRAVSPTRTLTRDCETSTRVPLLTQGTNTMLVFRVDIGVQSKHVSTCDRETSMLRRILLEKETSTPNVHLLHKNTSTDNQVKVDNQTTMTSDVRAAYLGAITRHHSTISRGTCTPRRPAAFDRASSPVRFSCVDKAVLATKGDALEPMDTFPGVGKSKARRPFVSSRKAKLDCISEGTIEEETEDSVADAVDCVSSKLSSFRLRMVQRSMTLCVQEKAPKSFAKCNKISLAVSPRPRKPLESTAFSFDVEPKEVFAGDMMEELEENFDNS